MKISVFIPTFNRCESLELLFESLLHQTYKNFELVVVDGGSSDGTRKLVKDYSEKLSIVFFKQTREGIVGAANDAIENASGEIFTRTDDDVVVTPDWLKEIAHAFGSDESIGGVTGPTIIPEDRLCGRDLTYFNQKMQNNPSLFWRAFSRIYYGYFMEGQPFAVSRFFRSGAFSLGSNYKECLNLEGLIPADHLEACNSSIRRELVERAGGYDPKYVGMGEYHEPDLAFKVKALGYKLVFNPKAILYHRPSISGVFETRPQAYGRSKNFILFYFRHIKPNTPDKLCRFTCYLMFQNTYWLYKFITSGKPSQLMGILGTLVALIKYLPEIKNVKLNLA